MLQHWPSHEITSEQLVIPRKTKDQFEPFSGEPDPDFVPFPATAFEDVAMTPTEYVGTPHLGPDDGYLQAK